MRTLSMRSPVRRVLIVTIGTLFVAHGSAFAQIPRVFDDLKPGARVRANGLLPTPRGNVPYEYTGVVDRFDGTHLYLSRPDRASLDTLPFFAMQKLAVSTGLPSRSELEFKGALAGAIMGAAFWGLTRAVPDVANPPIQSDGSVPPGYRTQKQKMERIALIGIPVFAFGGFFIASGVDREQWVGMSIPMGN